MIRRPHAPHRLPKPFRCAALAALAAVAAMALAGPAAAQDLRLSGLRGEQLRAGDLAQGTTIVVVWASWSPRGRDVVARVNALAGRWGDSARVITVNFQEDRPTVERFLAGKGLSVPVFLDADGAFGKRYAVTHLPGLVVIQNGETAYNSKLPDDPNAVLGEILR